MSYPRIDRLLNGFREAGVEPSENLARSLHVAYEYAAAHDYVPATDVLLHGLFKTNNTVTSIAAELTDKPDQFTEILERAIRHYRDQPFPPELTRHCSIGFPQYAVKKGYTDADIRDSNAPVYHNMLTLAKKESAKAVENQHLLKALLEPQQIRYWAVVWAGGLRRDERPTLASDVLTELRINPIQLMDLVQKIPEIEAAHECSKFIIYFDGKRFRFRPFDLMNGYRIIEAGTSRLFVAKASLIDHSTLVLQEELEELEWLINRENVSESEIQKFLERHPKFLIGAEYKQLHAQLTLHRDAILGPQLRPDFFLERITSNFCDIVDLKLPNEKLVIRKKNRVHFSAALTQAMAQLREYRDYFDDRDHREMFHRKYGVRAFRPRVSVVIGRRANYYDEMERIKLESDLAHLRVITYDDLVDQARRRVLIAAR